MSDTIEEPVDDESLVETADVEDAEGADASVAGTRRRDPVQRWLMIVMGLVLLVFVSAAAALVMYALSMRNAPRTAVERALSADEVAVKETPDDVENWARLALSYAAAERWSDAMSTIERGRKVKEAAILDLVEADVLRLKRDEDAIAAYDRAIKSAQVEYDAMVEKAMKEKGVVVTAPNSVGFEAMYGRTIALDMFGRTDEAIAQAKKALEITPTDADLLVVLGDIYAKAGRKAEAEAQYREALRFVPDLQSALDGLARLGKE